MRGLQRTARIFHRISAEKIAQDLIFFVPRSRVSRVSHVCLRYDQPTARRNARQRKISSGLLASWGSVRASLAAFMIFFPREDEPFFFSRLGMTACGLQSLALIQLYDESLLIKVCLRYRARAKRDARARGRRDDLVGHGFHAFAMEMRDVGRVENSGPIRGRE